MHDIDRTQIAYPGEMESYEMTPEFSTLSEAEEMELASRLMELEKEEEFENILGDIISGVASAAGGLISPSVGNALGGRSREPQRSYSPLPVRPSADTSAAHSVQAWAENWRAVFPKWSQNKWSGKRQKTL
jgi:hypothetical protein